jgi:hypothetical protein
LRNEKKCFSRMKTAIDFSLRMDNSMWHNGHRVVDELRRLKILRAPHPSYSRDISLCDFWMFGDFEGKLKDSYLQSQKKILWYFKNCEITLFLRSLKWYLSFGATGCVESLDMTESNFVNEICTIRLFHEQVKTGVCFHYFSATLYLGLQQ